MKRFYTIIILACISCLSEKNIDPGAPPTFIKYYNGGFNDVAQDIRQTSDGGFILLATSEVRASDVTDPRFKIKLVKVDEFGTPQWQRVYPAFESDANGEPLDTISFRGRSIEVLRDGAGLESGYVIVGDSIQKETGAQSHLRIMTTDLEGNITRARNFKPAFAVHGNAVNISTNGNFVVLGSAVNVQETTNMLLAELDQNLNMQWVRTYGAGASSLTNKLFIDAQSSMFWSGTVTKNNRSDIRLVKTPPNSENTEFDLPIGSPLSNETGQDICQYGFGFAVIGTTNESGDQDILFKRLAQDGRELSSKTFGFPNQAENGFSISQARDGGLILLGSVDTNLEIGRGGKDYYLIKINAFGDEEWTRIFGSKNDDLGNNVLSLSDGSYVVYGTTLWGGLRTLTLIKTDKLGQVE